MARRARSRELTLDEILKEPIIRLLMRRDGVEADEVRALMRNLSLRNLDLGKRA